MSTMLNAKQQIALDLILKGHNLVLLGKAGTGKSYSIQTIVQSLVGKKCVVTATTGIACHLYPPSLKAIHCPRKI